MVLAVIAIGLAIALAHYASEHLHFRHKSRILSFTAGISIAYIFLFMFPEFSSTGLFISTLAGFSAVHVVHTHVQKHKSLKFRREMMDVHASAFFVYYVVMGISIVNIERYGIVSLILFSIPVILHTIASSTSLSEIHSEIKKNRTLA